MPDSAINKLPTYTSTKPWITTKTFKPNAGNYGVTGTNEFLIERVALPTEGQVLCMHGAVTFSHCGRVPMKKTLINGVGTNVKMCGTSQPEKANRAGDSGGPFYSKTANQTGVAIGTVSNRKAWDVCITTIHNARAAEKKFNVSVLTGQRGDRTGGHGEGLPDCGRWSCLPG